MDKMVLYAAILPAIILIIYIFRKDSLKPEPKIEILKAFGIGILSVPLSLCISGPMAAIFGGEDIHSLGSAAYTAFCLAAIPEETAKLILLYLFLRKNRHFDEYMDGIVYAVAIGMGFAAAENVSYLFGNLDQWFSLAVTRGIISVPGHFAFAVIMGYYFSIWRIEKSQKAKRDMLLYPILAHGTFDFILMYSEATPAISGILTAVFFVFLIKLHQHCRGLVAMHFHNDSTTESQE